MTTIRKVLAAGVGLLCLVSVGGGAYLEDTDSVPVRELPPVVIHPRPPEHVSRHPIQRLVRAVQPGAPTRYRNLTIFPLVVNGRGGRGIRTLDEALSHGWISISEQRDANVGELLVRNDSRYTVFLMAGEIITGGKQNRIIRRDILLGAHSGSVVVPVYCGEKDRWDAPRAAFKSSGAMADPSLRELAATSGSQASIWGRIDRRMEAAEIQSSTRDYQQIYKDKSTRRRLDEYATQFRHLHDRRTVGLVAVSGGRIVGCDIFSDAALLSGLWDKICRSYAVETLGQGLQPAHRHIHEGITTRDINRFLDGIFSARFERQGTPGSGEATRISGAIHGNALSWQGEVVHAALFPGVTIWRDNTKLPEPRSSGGRGNELWDTE
jgi:hypothetical protein